ncbi:hypothetical protein KCU60_g55, partial [Aureobasidium melanogenum]
MNTLEPFLHNRIQTTRLIEVYIVDRGHNRGIVVCKLNEPLVPLFLEESTEWHCNARGKPPNMNCSKQQPCSLQRVSRIQGSRGWANGVGFSKMVHASMSVIRKYAETMSMCSRLWAGTQNMRCTSWNQLMLAAWPVSVSLFISISHQRSELDTYGPDAGMISAFESR